MSTKMKARRDAVVHVVGNKGSVHGAKVVIVHLEGEFVTPGADYALSLREDADKAQPGRGSVPVIATCEYAKRLSDWAFDHGAQEVRHDYHLGLSDWEP